MKTKAQKFIKISSNVDDHGKRIKYYDLRIGTWNVLTLHRVGVSAQLADSLKKCRTDINAIQEMRWTEQGCKRLASCDAITAAMLVSTNSDANLWLIRNFATLSLSSHL